jgi:hypothetical protein
MRDFGAFVRHAFWMVHGEKLGDQPYVDHLCYGISRLIDGEINRLLINLPPQVPQKLRRNYLSRSISPWQKPAVKNYPYRLQ